MSIDSKNKILAIGDCNTSGVGKLVGHSYPERIEQRLKISVTNCGHTLATSREGFFLLRDHLTDDCTIVIIQYGMGDSSLTLRYVPYVLSYPDNIFRKPYRNILKKIKKLCRKYGINKKLGETYKVPLKEYSFNIRRMIEMCGGRTILFPETIPNRDPSQNERIELYNRELAAIAAEHVNCHLVKIYKGFSNNMPLFYLDDGHANAEGFEYTAERILQVLKSIK